MNRKTKLFYVPASQANPHPRQIDVVMELSNGTVVGYYSGETQEQIETRYGEKLSIATIEDFIEMREASLVTSAQEITENDYITALEVLPPYRWEKLQGVESFRMSERYDGNMTHIYARSPDGRYWKFMDNIHMDSADLTRKVLEAAAASPARPSEPPQCEDCGAETTDVMGAPDGSEICKECFSAGAH